MAEIPDFDQFARRWCYSEDTDDVSDFEARIVEMVAELKAIWNARGAADAKTERVIAALRARANPIAFEEDLDHPDGGCRDGLYCEVCGTAWFPETPEGAPHPDNECPWWLVKAAIVSGS